MTSYELKAKIEAGGGRYVGAGGIVFRPSDDDTSIEAFDGKKKIGWMFGEPSEFYITGADLKEVTKWVSFLAAEFGLSSDSPSVIDRPVYRERIVKEIDEETIREYARASGKVEAYEKILVGRSVNLSK